MRVINFSKKMCLRLILALVIVCGICLISFKSGDLSSVRAEEVTVSSLSDLQTALSTADSSTEIIVSSAITLTDGIDLDGNGATIRVETPYVDEAGYVNSSYSNYGVFVYGTGTYKLSNMIVMGGGNGYYVPAIKSNDSGGTIYLDNVTITRSNRGLSINSGGYAVLTNCSVSRNVAYCGGGILCNGTLVMDNCSLSENRSTSSGGGGGAMEISGVAYINNTVISNNSSTEIGGAINLYGGEAYLINSTLTGNVTTRDSSYGGAIGVNGGAFYAANSIIVDNYSYYDSTFTRSDIGFYYGNTSLTSELRNCVYGAIVGSSGYYTYSTCKTDTSNSTTRGYITNPIISQASSVTGSFTHPAVVTLDAEKESLYVPVSTTGYAASGGVNTYFNYDSLSDIKIGYGSDPKALGSATVPSDSDQITDYFEGTTRVGGVIGASATTTKNIYTLTLGSSEYGTTKGVSIYADSYLEGTDVTLTSHPYTGYSLNRWVLEGTTTSYSSDNPYTFAINENITVSAEYYEAKTLSYDANGGSGSIDSVDYEINTAATVADGTALSRTNYQFDSWNTASDGSGTAYNPGDSITMTSDITLYAIWEELPDVELTVDNYSAAYDGEAHTISLSVSAPTSGYTILYGTSSDECTLTEAPSYTNAGTYTIYFEITADGYSITTGSGTITITKYTENSYTTAPIATQDFTYDGSYHELCSAGVAEFGDVLYSIDGETFSTTIPQANTCGQYIVYYKVLDTDNYSGIAEASFTVNILEVDKTDLIAAYDAAVAYHQTIKTDYPDIAEALYEIINNASVTITTINSTTTEVSNVILFLDEAMSVAKVDVVIEDINSIGTVEYSDACNTLITTAREKYDALTDEEKADVTNYPTLTVAETTYNANKAIALIDAIGDVAYTDASKALIDTARDAYDSLADEEKALVPTSYLTALEAAEDLYEAVDEAVSTVNSIGALSYSDTTKSSITSARSAYDSLSSAEKAIFPASSLTSLENNEAAYSVIEAIYAIGEVTNSNASADAIEAAREAYDALTDEQKELIASDDYEVLTEAETSYDDAVDDARNKKILGFSLLFLLLIIIGALVAFYVVKKHKKANA